MTRPWLSVIVPTHNGAAHLPAALESIVGQDAADIEVLAIDDGSTDGTTAILELFAKRLPLRILRHDTSGNWAANTNVALAVAQADHACFLHQDDLWLPGRLRVLRSFLERVPAASMLLHSSWFITSGGQRVGLWRCPLPGGRLLPPEFVVERLVVQNFIAAPAPLFRRDVALRVGGLDSGLWYAADWDFWLKLAGAGPVAYHPVPLAAFRIHPLSQTVSRTGAVGEIRRQLQSVLDKHLGVWAPLGHGNPAVRRRAAFGAELNTQLLAAFHGLNPSWFALVRQFLSLDPASWWFFVRDSRITERVLARLRAGMLPLPWATFQGHRQPRVDAAEQPLLPVTPFLGLSKAWNVPF